MDDLDRQIIRDYCQGTLEELQTDLEYWVDKWTWDDDSDWTHAIVKGLEEAIEERKNMKGFTLEITTAKIADAAITTLKIADGFISYGAKR